MLLYRYFGTDPMHADNCGLREAMMKQVPLVYLKWRDPKRLEWLYAGFLKAG